MAGDHDPYWVSGPPPAPPGASETGGGGTEGGETAGGGSWRAELPPPPVSDPTAAPASGGWRIPRIVIRIAAVALIGAVGAWWSARDDASRGADGAIAAGGELAADDLRPGDCLMEPEEEEFASTGAVPCAAPHDLEVFHAYTLPDGSYPEGEAMFADVEAECLPAFATYVGISYEDSEYYLDVLTPTSASWAAGDQELLCYLYLPDEQAVGSARGSRR